MTTTQEPMSDQEYFRIIKTGSRTWYVQEVATGEVGVTLSTRRLAVEAALRRNRQRAEYLRVGPAAYYQSQKDRLRTNHA